MDYRNVVGGCGRWSWARPGASCGADGHTIHPYTARICVGTRLCYEAGCVGSVLSPDGTEDKLRALRLLTMACHENRPYLPARDGAGTSAPRGLCPRPAPGGPLRGCGEEGLYARCLHGGGLLRIGTSRTDGASASRPISTVWPRGPATARCARAPRSPDSGPARPPPAPSQDRAGHREC
jgi:hypothetical protein